MFGLNFSLAPAKREHAPAATSSDGASVPMRRVVLLRSGRRHGPITRLMTPWDIGELTQPFLFLACAEFAPGWQPLLAVHPQPGVATLTLVLRGTLAYRDGTGTERTLGAGGCRWTTAGEYVRHDGGRVAGERLRAFHLWIALPAAAESSAAGNRYLVSHEMQEEGPVRVILGQFGGARGSLAASGINYFHVRLRDGERWRYVAPDGHNVTWLAVDHGGLRLREGERVYWEQIALFGDSRGEIELQADGETSFVLGSARRLTYSLTQDSPLIDATRTALTPDEEGGRRGQRQLRALGRC